MNEEYEAQIRRAIVDWRARAVNAASNGYDLTAATLRMCADEAEAALVGRLALLSPDEAARAYRQRMEERT